MDLLILLWFAANPDLMMNPIESDHESWILLLIWCWILNPNPNPEANPNLHCSSQCKHCSEQCNLFLVVFFSLEILFWFLLKTLITEIQQTETIFEKSCATEDVFRKYYQTVYKGLRNTSSLEPNVPKASTIVNNAVSDGCWKRSIDSSDTCSQSQWC